MDRANKAADHVCHDLQLVKSNGGLDADELEELSKGNRNGCVFHCVASSYIFRGWPRADNKNADPKKQRTGGYDERDFERDGIRL